MRRLLVAIGLGALAACSGNKYTEDLDAEKAPSGSGFFKPEQVMAGNESVFAPDLSPNGGYVVYTSDRKGNKDIWEKRATGGFARPLTFHSADDFAPVISPGGDAIAFVSRREDAAGDIHVLRFGFSIDGLFGASEGDIGVISSKQTEDTNPSWYPNGEKIVFAARKPGEKTPTVMVSELKDMKPVPLGDARGDQPSVSPDGKFVAFVRDGAIFLFNDDGDKITQITAGGTLQDGQPRFTQDGKSLVFTRYADDTNRDGKLDGDDRPTIWKLDLAQQEKEKLRENYLIEPLTSAAFGAYSPQIRAPYLYLALQTADGLDIFRLPEAGQAKAPADLDAMKRQFDSQSGYYEKTFVLRLGQATFMKQGRDDVAGEAALLELDWLVQNGRGAEARWSAQKMKENLPKQTAILALADLGLATLDLEPLLYPRFKSELTDAQRKRLGELAERVDALMAPFTDKDVPGKRVIGAGMVVKAKILASQRQFFEANGLLAKVQENFPSDKTLLAAAAFYAAQITTATSDVDSTIRAFRGVVEKFPEDRNFVRLSSEEAVNILKGRKDYVEALVALRTEALGLPAMPALAHIRIADYYAEQNKVAVEANELRQIVDSYPASTSIRLDAAERLAPLEERAGRYDAAEEILVKLNKSLETSRPENKKRGKDLLIGFWLRRGEAYLKENDPALAAKEYKKVTDADPWNVAAHRGLIDAAFREKKLEKLEDAYEKAADEDPTSAEKRYIYGYALTYEIDRAKGIRPRLAAIDDAIVEVEAARNINSQILQIHQTLGWLYLQKGFWIEKYFASGAVLAKARQKIVMVKDFFGSGDPNWLELGIDAFQTGYYLTKDGSLERAGLAQDLAQTFYELKNFQKSLSYYMQRIKMLPLIPTRDVHTEGVLWRRAGRSAFNTDELELAENLQRNALTVWEKIADDELIAQALDALALTLRERGRYKEALVVYERLLALQERLKMGENVAGTLSSLGYCKFMDNRLADALADLDRAEKQILAVKAAQEGDGDKPAEADGAIPLDLSGQGSAAKGFDLFARQNLVVTFRARIYEKLERYDLALEAYERKLAMLKAQREKLMDEGKSEKALAEEIAVAENNIGEQRLKMGDHWKARLAFQAATDTAKFLRPEGQKYLSPGEAINTINGARVDLRLAAFGLLPDKDLADMIKRLDDTAVELRPVLADGAKAQAKPLAQVLSLSASLKSAQTGVPIDDAQLKASLEESLGILRRGALASTSLHDGAMLAYAAKFDGNAGDDELKGDIALFRENAAASPSLEWKVLAAKDDWDKAFEAVDRYVLAGGSFRSPTDRLWARKVFERLMAQTVKAGAPPERASLYLRRYLLMRHTDMVLRSMPVEVKVEIPPNKERDGEDAVARTEVRQILPKAMQKLLTLKDDKTIAQALAPDEAVLTVHRAVSGGTLFATLQSKDGVKVTSLNVAAVKKGDEGVFAPLASFVPAIVSRLYIVPSGELVDVAWEKVPGLAEKRQLAFLPTIDAFPVFFAQRSLSKGSVGHIPWNGSGEAVRAANVIRDYEALAFEGPGHAGLKFSQYNIVHVDSPLKVNDVEPGRSVLHVLPEAAAFTGDMTMKQLASLDLTATLALIFANVQRENQDLASTPEGHEGWAMLALAAGAAGAPSVIAAERPVNPAALDPKAEVDDDAPNAAPPAPIDWAAFYKAMEGQPLSAALAASGIPARIFGYAGIPASEELAYAKEHLKEATTLAEEAADENDLDAAVSALRRAYYYNILLKDDAGADDAMGQLVDTLYKKRDFAGALHFKKKIAARLKVTDEDRYAQALVDAAVLAVHAKKFDDATKLLDEAEAIFAKADEPAQLGKIYQYRGINFENQKKYDETIAAYTKSREIFLEETPKQGAQRLLDIANVYRNYLSDYPKALEFYDQAAQEFKKLDDQASYISVTIDRANTLMQIGQLELAISLLEKTALPAIDVEKQRVTWVRATQRLANAYYLAGVYQEARDLNERTLVEAGKIEQAGAKVECQIDAINLRAMILAKLGNPQEAFKDFRTAIATATEYKLTGKIAQNYNNYGFWAREYGDVDQSIEFFNIAHRLDTELKSKSSIAYDQRNMGLSIILKGDYNRARELLKSALATSEELHLAYNTVYCYFGLGDMALREQAWDEAEAQFKKALELAEKSYLQDFTWRAYAGIAAAQAKKDVDDQTVADNLAKAVSIVEKLRAGLKSEASRNAFLSDAGVQQVYDQYVDVLMQLGKVEEAWTMSERARSRAFIDSLGTQKIKFAETEAAKLIEEEKDLKGAIETAERKKGPELAAAQAKYADLLSRMRAADAQLAQFVNVEALTKAELGKLLPGDTALVEYAVTPEHLDIWVIQGGSLSGVSVPVLQQDLQARIRDFRMLMQNFSSTEYLGKELADLLIAPIADKIKGAKRLAIVPHQNLHFLPFAALPFEKGALVDRFSIYYLDSAMMARFTHGPNPRKIGESTPLLAMAPAEDLPFAAKESAVISRYFPKVTLKEGAEASEAALKAGAESFGALHVAAHGEFKPSAPGESRLVMADGGLSVTEVFGLDTKADLVTLSACESGLGKLSLGDEIVGMNRAFLFSGASTVVSALWRISDVASGVTMKRFYRYLAEGDDKAEAMRKAQILVRKYHPHPAYWSSFRVIGDYR